MAIYQKVRDSENVFQFVEISSDATVNIEDGVWNAYVPGILPSEGQILENLLTKVPEGGLIIDDKDGTANEVVEALRRDWITYIPGILSLEGDNIEHLTRYVPEGGLIIDDE